MDVRSHSKAPGRTITFLLIIGFVAIAGSALAGTSVVDSKHNLSMSSVETPFAGQFQIGAPTDFGPLIDEVCVFCHTPHGASSDAQTNTLLWNRVSSPPGTYTYTPYTSSTITGPDTANGGKPTVVSMMCMSCHDGVTSIAVNTLLNAPGQGNPQISLDQFSTLPNTAGYQGAIGTVFQGQVGFGWGPNIGNAIPGGGTIDLSNDHPISFEMPAARPDLQDPASLRLFGASGRRIECATCHRVHNPSIEPFLAMSNAQSLLCRQCHIK